MGDSSGAARTFEAIDDDIRAAGDALLAAQPGLRGIVIFGLCDAASAALMYCNSDARVKGLMLANPWVRTEGGAARAVVRHYYGRRLLQRSFWSKVFKGEYKLFDSLRGFTSMLRSSRGGVPAGGAADNSPDFLQRMLRGLADFRGPVLLLLSDRDLTAREFQDLCRDSPAWSRCVSAANIAQQIVADADHTFSSKASLQDVCSRGVVWLEALARDAGDTSAAAPGK
jgi:exosortase A-associated hydrolase 1